MFYNIKKICVKQITQISFNLLFITGDLLIVFFGAKSGGLSFYDRQWNRLERRLGALLLSLPDAHYLATDGYDVQDRNYQEQEQT